MYDSNMVSPFPGVLQPPKQARGVLFPVGSQGSFRAMLGKAVYGPHKAPTLCLEGHEHKQVSARWSCRRSIGPVL